MGLGLETVYEFPQNREFTWVTLENNSILNSNSVLRLENAQMIWLGGKLYIARMSNRFGIVEFV